MLSISNRHFVFATRYPNLSAQQKKTTLFDFRGFFITAVMVHESSVLSSDPQSSIFERSQDWYMDDDMTVNLQRDESTKCLQSLRARWKWLCSWNDYPLCQRCHEIMQPRSFDNFDHHRHEYAMTATSHHVSSHHEERRCSLAILDHHSVEELARQDVDRGHSVKSCTRKWIQLNYEWMQQNDDFTEKRDFVPDPYLDMIDSPKRGEMQWAHRKAQRLPQHHLVITLSPLVVDCLLQQKFSIRDCSKCWAHVAEHMWLSTCARLGCFFLQDICWNSFDRRKIIFDSFHTGMSRWHEYSSTFPKRPKFLLQSSDTYMLSLSSAYAMTTSLRE